MAGRRETIVDRAERAIESRNGGHRDDGKPLVDVPPKLFPDPKPISGLERGTGTADWLWHGYFARETVTLLSSMWKVGKTTLIAHLLKTFAEGGTFCGHTVRPTKLVYVTEEPEWVWAVRRDKIGLLDHVHILSRPFTARPTQAEWVGFLNHIASHVERLDAGLVFIDPLTTIWPVLQENEAGLVTEALAPLRSLTKKAGVVLLHHFRKTDGGELTGSRGSGALMGFVDTILELRRMNASNLKDTRRVLTGGGRFDETPDELVIELTDDGYVTHGNKAEVKRKAISEVIRSLLPLTEPGWTWETVKLALDEALGDEGPGPGKPGILNALNEGHEFKLWDRSGEGVKGDPHRYRITPEA